MTKYLIEITGFSLMAVLLMGTVSINAGTIGDGGKFSRLEGRFALIAPEAPETLRLALQGTSEVTEVPVNDATSIIRGESGGEKGESSLEELEMGDRLVVMVDADGFAQKVTATYTDWRSHGRGIEVDPNPEYLGIHRTTTGSGPVGAYWSQGTPESINQRGIDELLGMIETRGRPDRQLAFSYTISYMNTSTQKSVQTLENMLALAEQNDLAVIVHLDGVNFWGARPDLWNWWNPDRPGFDPENVYNVEWHDWGPENAVKIGWRHWGRQVRIEPQANLASPAVLEAHKKELDVLIPIIRNWYDRLEENRKYLLAGVVLGWEVSPYVQSYYYEDGNAYLNGDPTQDPTGGSRASVPLGYAALTSLGLEHSGSISEEDVDAVVKHYLSEIVGRARELGLPPDKTISHTILHPGTPDGGAHSGIGAIVEGAMPGWSFYNETPSDVDPLLDKIDGSPWAAIEIKHWGLSIEFLESFFDHRNGRIVNIFNWESIRFNSNTVDVLRKVLEAEDEGA